ncbi:hypothetical protein ABZ864_20290 [Streptomyces sp. NPDC047082]|uniref:hypothetical protein n=1 Tax=Streptomyces sp. NPDC047082 TaxID=3155259 RepID=UPI0033E8BC26
MCSQASLRADAGPTDEEREVLASLGHEHRVSGLGDTDPIPLVPLAQLFARDVPGLVVPEGRDLLQVLWYPFDAHGSPPAPDVHLVWRGAAEIGDLLAGPPLPAVVGHEGYVPEPCTLHPEQVTEHEWAELLPKDLQLRLASAEWGGVRSSWTPLEDLLVLGTYGLNVPTRVSVGRGGHVDVFVCSADPAHDHRSSLQ